MFPPLPKKNQTLESPPRRRTRYRIGVADVRKTQCCSPFPSRIVSSDRRTLQNPVSFIRPRSGGVADTSPSRFRFGHCTGFTRRSTVPYECNRHGFSRSFSYSFSRRVFTRACFYRVFLPRVFIGRPKSTFALRENQSTCSRVKSFVWRAARRPPLRQTRIIKKKK